MQTVPVRIVEEPIPHAKRQRIIQAAQLALSEPSADASRVSIPRADLVELARAANAPEVVAVEPARRGWLDIMLEGACYLALGYALVLYLRRRAEAEGEALEE